ncbi:MAG: hypothetical protein ABS873_06510, partial [Alkalibacterium sp.]
MMNFWLNFIVLAVNWAILTGIQGLDVPVVLLSVLFFAGYFLLPILSDKGVRIVCLLLPLISLSAYWRSSASVFLWLILIVLSLEFSLISNKRAYFLYTIYSGGSLSVLLAA